MKNFKNFATRICVALLFAVVAGAQSVTSDGSGVAFKSFNHLMVDDYFNKTIGLGAVSSFAIATGADYASVKIMHRRSEGVDRIFERAAFENLTYRSILLTSRVLFHEDDTLQIREFGKPSFSAAALNIVSVQHATGERRFAWPRILALVGTVAIASQWKRPQSVSGAGFERRIGVGLSVMVGKSIYNEYYAYRVRVIERRWMRHFLVRN